MVDRMVYSMTFLWIIYKKEKFQWNPNEELEIPAVFRITYDIILGIRGPKYTWNYRNAIDNFANSNKKNYPDKIIHLK